MAKSSQLAIINNEALTEQDVMSAIDLVVEHLRQTNDMTEIIRVSNIMDKINKVSGLAKAKLLWNWSYWYKETGQEEKRGDVFEDMIESETGTKSITAKRYILAWGYIEDCIIPKEIQSRPMDDLIKIATTLDNDYDISKENWKELEKASNSAEVREILRKIKGQEPRKSGVRKVLSRDGSLNLYDSQGGKHFAGYLELKSDDELVQKFIRQFVQNMQVEEK